MTEYRVYIKLDGKTVDEFPIHAVNQQMAEHLVSQYCISKNYDMDKIEWRCLSMDAVNHPTHYTSSKAICSCGKQIECIEIVRHFQFALGNALKYIWRADLKNGVEDLKKAVWYLNDEIKRREDLEND